MMRRLIAMLGFNIILLAGGGIWRRYETRRPTYQMRITSLRPPLATAETSMQIAG